MPSSAARPTAAQDVVARTTSIYPAQFQDSTQGREKRALGDFYGLENFGVNQTTLSPGTWSALAHCHKLQDEFIFILQGTATLVYGDEEIEMIAGQCMGFRAGEGIPHGLVNRSKEQPVVYLEIGDRTPGDEVSYASADLKAIHMDGKFQFFRKDGQPYANESDSK